MDISRKAYNTLLEWKESSSHSKAIMIKGARRVGKSYLAEHFSKNEYKSVILIDFSSPRKNTIKIFEEYGNRDSINEFFNQLSVLYGVPLYEKESVIIFDEVQKYPKAREFIKHLVADDRYDFIETGSLISIKKNVKDIIIPSEESELELHPIDFEEYLNAMSDTTTVPFLRQAYNEKRPLGNMLKPVMEKLRNYMLVGGMPQSVSEYISSGNVDKVEKTKREILKLYRDDIAKYSEGYEAQARAIFDAVPAQLAHHDKKIKYSSIGKGDRYSNYKDAIYWLGDSMVCNLAYASDAPNLFGGFSLEQEKVKVYMEDTGLLITLASGSNYLQSDLYKSFMLGKLSVNKGMMTENLVAQMFAANGHNLRFFEDRVQVGKGFKKYEVDFMIPDGQKITPIEVKSGNSASHPSIDYFCKNYKRQCNKGILLTKGDLRETDKYLYLPLPMAMFL